MGSIGKTKKKNIPKSINEMSKEMLQETLKKKKECNAKALQTVEKLCEVLVEEEWFLDNLQFINQSHFDDATVERAISKLCGYPLCTNKLEKIPNQQYHISTRYNKVFDITERKNFCSGSCYKAAMFVKNQLFTSPLWFRDQEVIPKYTVLTSLKSSLGEEILFVEKIKVEPDDVAKKKEGKKDVISNDVADLEEKCSNLSLKEHQKVGDKTKEEKLEISSSKENNGIENKDEILSTSHIYEKRKDICLEDKENKEERNVESEDKNQKLKRETDTESNGEKKMVPKGAEKITGKDDKSQKILSKTDKSEKTKDIISEGVTKVEKCIFEWFSLDTLFYLYKEEKIKELFKEDAGRIKDALNSKLKMVGYGDKVNKMVQLFGLLDNDSISNNSVKTNLKPLPDYSVLKEEGKSLEIKVKAFYQGKLEIKPSDKEEVKEEKKEAEKDECIYLPLIDAHAQMALRRKIVLDKLNKVVPDLVRIFTTDYLLQMSDVRDLVSTFSLEAHNITFKPNEWYLVALILLKLLSLKDKNLKSVLDLESTRSQIELILLTYKLQKEYLDIIIDKLTNGENILEKLNKLTKKLNDDS